jgi:hypothetical protein
MFESTHSRTPKNSKPLRVNCINRYFASVDTYWYAPVVERGERLRHLNCGARGR